MTPEQFCYWLQGAFETMDEGRALSSFDHTVRDHLTTVFHKVTPVQGAQYQVQPSPDYFPNKTIC